MHNEHTHSPRALHRLAVVGALGLSLALAPVGGSLAQAEVQGSPAAVGASEKQAYKDHALGQVGGNRTQFGCLDRLWERESGWNPHAQNPTSSAYGIPQFLDSTWASTGIRKTSDPYRQIKAGLIYIGERYGSPCGAWDHSRSTGWY
ncbi:aggregation-promoting factor C-terminal-like domain-containing protein [Geodermatophilus sp. SYSU D01105]